jgi:serine/threonine protein kinase
LAPEIVKHHQYSYAIDWWALGVLLCEMITGETPFPVDNDENNKKLYEAICQSEPVYPEGTDPDACDLMNSFLIKEPSKRARLGQVKVHPFFEGLDWELVENQLYCPNFVPECELGDTKYFDPVFTSEPPVDSSDSPEDDLDVDGFAFDMPGLERTDTAESFALFVMSPEGDEGNVVSHMVEMEKE